MRMERPTRSGLALDRRWAFVETFLGTYQTGPLVPVHRAGGSFLNPVDFQWHSISTSYFS